MKKKRVLYFLVISVLGYFFGMFLGRAGADGLHLDITFLIPWIAISCLFLAFASSLLAFYFLKKSRRFHAFYQMEMDDDLNETYYVQMYRHLEFGTISFNGATVMALLALFLSINEVALLHKGHLTFALSSLVLLLSLVLQKYLYKTIAIVRQFHLVFFSTPKDMLDYINSYDEGERQANLEQSFRILFQLNQFVLPALYFLVAIISIVTREIQLVAFVLVAAIHMYINVMQLPMIKRYFK